MNRSTRILVYSYLVARRRISELSWESSKSFTHLRGKHNRVQLKSGSWIPACSHASSSLLLFEFAFGQGAGRHPYVGPINAVHTCPHAAGSYATGLQVPFAFDHGH